MATRRNLYSELLKNWAECLHADGAITDAEKQDIEANLDSESYSEAINAILPVVTSELSKLVLNKLNAIQANDELFDAEVSTSLNFCEAEVITHREYCFKEMNYASANGDLYVMTSSMLKKCVDAHVMPETEWKVFELMLLKDVSNMNFLTSRSSDLDHDKKMVYVLTNKANPDVWRLYSYAYLCHINKDRVAIPSLLEYNPATHKFTDDDIVYDDNVQYEQYFDAYHVMNEAKHVQDILSRYLRMYQVLELFVYRSKLVEIEQASNRNSAFVRMVMKYSSRTSSDEKGQFLDGFKKVFPNIHTTVIKDTDIAPYSTFIYNVFQIASGDQHNPNKVGKIIYGLRNSVVHNKESELHFSFGNVEEYKDGINLMKVILPKMEKEIIKTISTPGCPVSYSKQTMPLY